MKLEGLTATLEVEISELDVSLDEVIVYVRKHYGEKWRFNRTEARYESCIIAIFEEVVNHDKRADHFDSKEGTGSRRYDRN